MVGRVRMVGRVGQGNRAVQGVRVGEVRTYASKRSFDIAHERANAAVNGNRHIVQIQILPCRPVLGMRADRAVAMSYSRDVLALSHECGVSVLAQQQALSSSGTRRAERCNESCLSESVST